VRVDNAIIFDVTYGCQNLVLINSTFLRRELSPESLVRVSIEYSLDIAFLVGHRLHDKSRLRDTLTDRGCRAGKHLIDLLELSFRVQFLQTAVLDTTRFEHWTGRQCMRLSG